MKKIISLLLLPAAAIFAQGPPREGFGPMGRGPGGGGPMGLGPMGARGLGGPPSVVTGAPYSALEVVQTQETLADGNTISRKHQTTVYRDSSGRVRMEETITPDAASGKQPFTLVTILDYVGGYRYMLDSSTMTAHQSPLRIPKAAASQSSATGLPRRGGSQQAEVANRPQLVRTALAPQSVNGVMASGTQHTETIPAGAIGNARSIQVSRTTWVSTELKVPVQIKSVDPRFGSTDMELTNIVQSEPSGALFVVPAGYTVKTGGRGPGGFGPEMRGQRPAPPQE